MGLDMYLLKKTYVKNWDHMKPEELHKITVKKGGQARKDIKPSRISEITEEVGYWRKANAIHNWMVKNVQNGQDDCREYYISAEKIQELFDLVNEVLASKRYSNLPTASGFFFGSTDYDEYYIQDLKRTKGILQQCLKEGGDYYYTSSW